MWLAWLAAKMTGPSTWRRRSRPRTVAGAMARVRGRVTLSTRTARTRRTG